MASSSNCVVIVARLDSTDSLPLIGFAVEACQCGCRVVSPPGETHERHIYVGEIIDDQSFSILKSAIRDRPAIQHAIVSCPTPGLSGLLISTLKKINQIDAVEENERNGTEISLLNSAMSDASSESVAWSICAKLLPQIATKAGQLFERTFPSARESVPGVGRYRLFPRLSSDFVYVSEGTGVKLNLWAPSDVSSGKLGSDRSGEDNFTVFGMLNKTTTRMGRRRLLRAMRHPMRNVSEIEHAGRSVSILLGHAQELRAIRTSYLSRLVDLDKFVNVMSNLQTRESMQSKCASLLIDTYNSVETVKSLFSYFSSSATVAKDDSFKELFLTPLSPMCSTLSGYCDLINHVFAASAVSGRSESSFSEDGQLAGTFVVRPELTPIMMAATEKCREVQLRVSKERARVERALELTAGSVRMDRDTARGFVFRVTKGANITSGNTKCKILRINKNETLFTTAVLDREMEELKNATSEARFLELAFIKKAFKVAITYLPVFRRLADLIGRLDVLGSFAMAVLSIQAASSGSSPFEWSKADFGGGGENEGGDLVNIVEGRHPLLEMKAAFRLGPDLGEPSTSKMVVSNSAVFSADRNQYLVSGPNMGGKSTYSRQVALAILLAQMGCPVPAKSMRMAAPVDVVMTRIGAQDDGSLGCSTFLHEAVETAYLLQTPSMYECGAFRSFLAIDELGRGTSTSDGQGLASALLEEMVGRKEGALSSSGGGEQSHLPEISGMFVTHFHRLLRRVKNAEDRIRNVCLDVETCDKESHALKFSYRIKDVSFGAEESVKSNGISLAEKCGFPKEIISAAMEYLSRISDQELRKESFQADGTQLLEMANAFGCSAMCNAG